MSSISKTTPPSKKEALRQEVPKKEMAKTSDISQMTTESSSDEARTSGTMAAIVMEKKDVVEMVWNIPPPTGFEGLDRFSHTCCRLSGFLCWVTSFIAGRDVLRLREASTTLRKIVERLLNDVLLSTPLLDPSPDTWLFLTHHHFWTLLVQWSSVVGNFTPMSRLTYRPLTEALRRNLAISGPLNPSQITSWSCVSTDRLEPKHIISCNQWIPQRHTCTLNNVIHGKSQSSSENLTRNGFLTEIRKRVKKINNDPIFWSSRSEHPQDTIRDLLEMASPTTHVQASHHVALLLRRSARQAEDHPLDFFNMRPLLRMLDGDFFCLLLWQLLEHLERLGAENLGGGANYRRVEYMVQLGHQLHHRLWIQMHFGWPTDTFLARLAVPEAQYKEGSKGKFRPRTLPRRDLQKKKESKSKKEVKSTKEARQRVVVHSFSKSSTNLYFTLCDHWKWDL